MRYYKTDNRTSRRWAWIALGAYAVLLAVAFAAGSVGITHPERPGQELVVEFVEPPVPDPPKPPKQAVAEPEHATPSPEESFDQVKGSDEATQTVNPKALFRMAKDGVDEPQDTGNPKAAPGERNTAAGTGSGIDAVNGMLDKGLQGRGLVGELPKPDYTANAVGRVLIDVTVDQQGRVTSAEFHPQGSTTSNAELVAAAKRAALKARFTESQAFVQGGTITYVFKMN